MATIPFVKDIDFRVGIADRLHPNIRRMIAGNPGPYTYTGSGTYIIGNGDVAVIDPGPSLSSHIDALCTELQDENVKAILITHTHLDHCGGAKEFSERTNAPIYSFGAHPVSKKSEDAPALDEGADYRFAPDETMKDGDYISTDDWTLEAVHTPGHLSNHLCFAFSDASALFTGDHIMGWATTVVAPPDGDMTAYIHSLEKLLDRNDEIYYPTHGAPIKNPHRFVRAVKAHRLMRDQQIIEQIKKGRNDIRTMVKHMYAEIDPRLHGAAALNVLAHLIRLTDLGTVQCDESPALNSSFTTP